MKPKSANDACKKLGYSQEEQYFLEKNRELVIELKRKKLKKGIQAQASTKLLTFDSAKKKKVA